MDANDFFSVGLENKNAKPSAALRSFQQQQSRYCEIIGTERKERGDTQTHVQGRRDTIIHKFIFCVGEFLSQGEEVISTIVKFWR